MPHSLLCILVVACAVLTGCPSPKSGVFEACQEYKRFIACEANLRAIPPRALDCVSLTKKFETLCSKADIEYATEAFKSDANRMCALKTEDDVKGFKPGFDASKISPACYQAADSCGLNCMRFDVNEVP